MVFPASESHEHLTSPSCRWAWILQWLIRSHNQLIFLHNSKLSGHNSLWPRCTSRAQCCLLWRKLPAPFTYDAPHLPRSPDLSDHSLCMNLRLISTHHSASLINLGQYWFSNLWRVQSLFSVPGYPEKPAACWMIIHTRRLCILFFRGFITRNGWEFCLPNGNYFPAKTALMHPVLGCSAF